MAEEGRERDIDIVIRQVHQQMPDIEVVQLGKMRDNDDDNLWWFSLPGVKPDIQVENPYCPLLLETNEQSSGQALKATTVDEAVEMIVSYLQSVKAGLPIHLTDELYW